MRRLIQSNFVIILFISFGLLSFSSHHSSYSQESDPTPYLFYYSNFHSSFIIEQADGSESYLLWDDLMDNQLLVEEIGWAPSGEWYAWQSIEPTDDSQSLRDYPAHLWVVNSQGKRLTTLDTETELFQVEWSPTQDILLVTAANWSEHVPPVYRSYLLDITKQTIIFELETEMSDSVQWAKWAPDGEHVLLYRSSWSTGDILEIRLIGLDGTMEVRDWSVAGARDIRWLPDGRLAWFTETRQSLHLEILGSEIETIRADGNYEYRYLSQNGQYWVLADNDRSMITVYNLTDNTSQEIELTDKQTSPFRWSPDEQFALVELQEANEQYDLALLNIGAGTLTKLDFPRTESYDLIEANLDWLDTNTIIFSSKDTVYAIDLPAQTLTELAETSLHASAISPNGVNLLHSGCRAEEEYIYFPICLTNLETNETRLLSYHSGAGNITSRLGKLDADWSPNNEWVILTEYLNIGGSNYPYFSVFDRFGRQHRELTDNTSVITWISDPAKLGFLYGQAIPSEAQLPVLNIVTESNAHSVTWHPLGPILAGGFSDQSVILYDTGAGQPFLTMHDAAGSAMRDLVWLPNDQLVGVSGNEMTGFTIHVWDGSNTVEPLLAEFPVEAEWDAIQGDVYLNLSTEWPLEPYAPTIKVDLANQQAAAQILIDAPSRAIATSESMLSLIARDDEPVILRIEDHDRQLINEVILAETGGFFSFTSVAVSPDESFLAGTSTLAGQVMVWDTKTGDVVARYPVSGRNLSFSPDNRQLAVAASSKILVWDLPIR